MIGKKLISSRVIPLYEVRERLKERGQIGELTYEQNIAEGYAKKFSKIPKSKGGKLMEELSAIEGLDEKLVVKITDILPKDTEHLNLILPKTVTLGEGIPQQIIDLVQKHSKK